MNLHRKHISYTSTGSIPAGAQATLSSIVGLYTIVKDLHKSDNKKKFEAERPPEDSLVEYLNYCTSYFDLLIEQCSEYRSVFIDQKLKASDYRLDENNHLLFRPIGQRAFSRATQVLTQRGYKLKKAVNTLLEANLLINSADWHNILWDPIKNTMITNQLVLAETQLLALSGCEARNPKSKQKLLDLIDARDS